MLDIELSRITLKGSLKHFCILLNSLTSTLIQNLVLSQMYLNVPIYGDLLLINGTKEYFLFTRPHGKA